ncbi:MAG: 50S ribosomal protein L17 [Spirochaetales bacterium]|nr:50S ribosomal protein L17 [Spirochaetales bacterium]
MKHRIGYNRIGRKASQRKALVKNMVTQLYRHERIRTTKTKALEVRRKAEKLISRAKEDSVHNRRIVAKLVQDKEVLAKLFTDIAPGFSDRPGGYTRILKLGYRKGDSAEMVLLELVGREGQEAPRRRRARPAVNTEPSQTEVTGETAAEESVAEAAERAASDAEVEAESETDEK